MSCATPAPSRSARDAAGKSLLQSEGWTYWAAVTCRLRHLGQDGSHTLDRSIVEVSDSGPEHGAINKLHDIKLIAQQVGGWTAKAED